jgi:hypothetical protein
MGKRISQKRTHEDRDAQQTRLEEEADTLIRATVDASYDKIHRAYHFAMGMGERLLLSYLVDFFYRLERKYTFDDDWFFCKVERMEEDINFSPISQTRFLKSLEHLGFIDLKRMGWPAKRYIRLNKTAIARAITEHKQRQRGRRRPPET